MKRVFLAVSVVIFVTPALSQQTDNPFGLLDWRMSAESYAKGAMCARKRLVFSTGDVAKLKRIAVEKAKAFDKDEIDEVWNTMMFFLDTAPTASECFEAFDKADFTGKPTFGF